MSLNSDNIRPIAVYFNSCVDRRFTEGLRAAIIIGVSIRLKTVELFNRKFGVNNIIVIVKSKFLKRYSKAKRKNQLIRERYFLSEAGVVQRSMTIGGSSSEAREADFEQL